MISDRLSLNRFLHTKDIELRAVRDNEVGVFAVRDLPAGTLILDSPPFAFTLSQQHHRTHCHYCFEPGNALQRCSRCKYAMYCSVDCQRAAWRDHHRVECGSEYVADSVALACRVFRKKEQKACLKVVFTFCI